MEGHPQRKDADIAAAAAAGRYAISGLQRIAGRWMDGLDFPRHFLPRPRNAELAEAGAADPPGDAMASPLRHRPGGCQRPEEEHAEFGQGIRRSAPGAGECEGEVPAGTGESVWQECQEIHSIIRV